MAERTTPELEAREHIDALLAESGWVVQSRDEINLSAGRGVAIREFPLKSGHGFADYLLFVDGQAVGVLEAKKVGFPLTGVEVQAQRYSDGLPDHCRHDGLHAHSHFLSRASADTLAISERAAQGSETESSAGGSRNARSA